MKRIWYGLCLVAGVIILFASIPAILTPISCNLYHGEKMFSRDSSLLKMVLKYIGYYILIFIPISIGFVMTKYGVANLIGNKAKDQFSEISSKTHNENKTVSK